MRKRIIATMLLMCLALLGFAPAYSEDITAILTAEPWTITGSTNLFTFKSDGTASLIVDSFEIPGSWEYKEPKLVFTYEMYGTREESFIVKNENNNWILEHETEGYQFMQKSIAENKLNETNTDISGYQLSLGENVKLPFVNFVLEKAKLTEIIGGKKSYRPASKGYQFFDVYGKISNSSKTSLAIGDGTRILFLFNGEYKYIGDVAMYDDSGLTYELQPMTNMELNISTQIPDAMVNQIDTAEIIISFNDNFTPAPKEIENGKYIFSLKLGKEDLATLFEGPEYNKVTFEECPILPSPISFDGVTQSGKDKTSSNGKNKKILYRFQFRGNNKTPADMMTLYINKLKEEGFIIIDTNNGTQVFSGIRKLAVIVQGSNDVQINIQPGYENLKK